MNKQDKVVKVLMRLANVNGVYWGEMDKQGIKYKGWVITVSHKKSLAELKSSDVIPKNIEGGMTDVIDIGEIKALAIDRKAKHRPFPMGVSVGHKDITAGTAGMVVEKKGSTMTFLLSNNHVLANVNKGNFNDEILQPGKADGGTVAKDTIGRLKEFIPIELAGTSNGTCTFSSLVVGCLNSIADMLGSSVSFSYDKAAVGNQVDCAIAELVDGGYRRNHHELGQITAYGIASIGDDVAKEGRTTGVTNGSVASTSYTALINMGSAGMALFNDQILINKPGFSAGGDSGSTVRLKGTNVVVGLLFAGSSQVTICNKIGNVFDALGVSV